MGAELSHENRQTDKQTWRSECSLFANFANAPSNNTTAGQETPQILSKSTVHFHVNNTASILSLLIKIYPAHPLPSHSLLRTILRNWRKNKSYTFFFDMKPENTLIMKLLLLLLLLLLFLLMYVFALLGHHGETNTRARVYETLACTVIRKCS